jgi:hypothetical protein
MPPFPGQLVRAEVGRRIGRDVDFEVPYDKHVLTALNLGEPRIVAAGRRGWGAVLSEIVDDADAIGREASTGAAGELAEREAVPATRASVEVASPDAGGVPDRRSGLGRRLWAFASGAKS